MLSTLVLMTALVSQMPISNVRVIDGDTFECTIKLPFGEEWPGRKIRVADFDAWESSRVRQTLDLTPDEWTEELRKGKLAKTHLDTLFDRYYAVVYEEPKAEQTYGRFTMRVMFVTGKGPDGLAITKDLRDFMREQGHERK